MRSVIALIGAIAWAGAALAADDTSEIKASLDAQEAAWNSGDLRGFMDHYWKDPGLRFVTERVILRGWDTIMERYNELYPDEASMNDIDLSKIEIEVIEPGASAMVFGEWTLITPEDERVGLFMQVYRKVDGQWVVVADRTGIPYPSEDGEG